MSSTLILKDCYGAVDELLALRMLSHPLKEAEVLELRTLTAQNEMLACKRGTCQGIVQISVDLITASQCPFK